jgi:uncharacterized RDD family membrane protein YckC
MSQYPPLPGPPAQPPYQTYTPPSAYHQVAQGVSATRAGFWRRFGALLIDGLIIGFIPWIIVLASGDSAGLGLALYFLIWLAYYTILEGGSGGQTLGKKAVGIRVADIATGAPIGYGRALGRTLFKIISWLFGLFPLGYLWMLWDDQKQTWHDKVARAVVVPVAQTAVPYGAQMPQPVAYPSQPVPAPVQTVPQAPPSWPANWYPDPSRERRLRYWDGSQWTQHTAD